MSARSGPKGPNAGPKGPNAGASASGAVAPASEEERFAENVWALCDAILHTVTEIHRLAPHEARAKEIVTPETGRLLVVLVRALKPADQINLFIRKTWPYWEQIRVRDEKFLLEAAGEMFLELPIGNIKGSMFADIVTIVDGAGKRLIQPDVEGEIWDLFQRMVKVSLKYVHRRRAPYGAGLYAEEFAPELDLGALAAVWGVKFAWPAARN